MTGLIAAIAVSSSSPAWAKDMTDAVAGLSVSVVSSSRLARHDPKSGYFAYKTLDCDGAHRSVRLTRDRRLVEEEAAVDVPGFGQPATEFFGQGVTKRSLTLATKHGVRIGMTDAQVRAKLGKPDRTWAKSPYSATLYRQTVMDDRENGSGLRNTYIFKSGKLIEVLLNLDSIPGCGVDGDPEQGWPWTKF